MLDRNDVTTFHPTWNAYMEQLRVYQENNGLTPPTHEEIYAACSAADPNCMRANFYFASENLFYRCAEARMKLGMTWDAFFTHLLDKTVRDTLGIDSDEIRLYQDYQKWSAEHDQLQEDTQP